MTFIYLLIMLSVIIVIHEAGHLLAAKRFGVYCYEFSFGMGPVLWKKMTKETQYSIRAIPIGGFVAMAGSNDDDDAHPDVFVPKGRRLTDAECEILRKNPNVKMAVPRRLLKMSATEGGN
jgi:regulator of sigma E protease